jgi:hypothetical protein
VGLIGEVGRVLWGRIAGIVLCDLGVTPGWLCSVCCSGAGGVYCFSSRG